MELTEKKTHVKQNKNMKNTNNKKKCFFTWSCV